MKKKVNKIKDNYTKVSTQSFKKYLVEVYAYKPLEVLEEVRLCDLMIGGDELAREKLIKHNLRFVISIAKQYYTKTTSLEDLINEGNVGLIIATHKFDSHRGFKFITYAVWWIRNRILKFINAMDGLVRIPNHKLYNINKINEAYSRLEQKLEAPPTFMDLKEKLNGEFSTTDINDFFNHIFSSDKRLDDELGYDTSGTTTVLDTIVNDVHPNSDVLTNISDSQLRLNSILSILKNDNQLAILTKMYGLDGSEPMPLEVISRDMGISKERVRQIKEKSLLILRDKLDLKSIYI